jgi:hypothetical protein
MGERIEEVDLGVGAPAGWSEYAGGAWLLIIRVDLWPCDLPTSVSLMTAVAEGLRLLTSNDGLVLCDGLGLGIAPLQVADAGSLGGGMSF